MPSGIWFTAVQHSGCIRIFMCLCSAVALLAFDCVALWKLHSALLNAATTYIQPDKVTKTRVLCNSHLSFKWLSILTLSQSFFLTVIFKLLLKLSTIAKQTVFQSSLRSDWLPIVWRRNQYHCVLLFGPGLTVLPFDLNIPLFSLLH